MYQPSVLHTIPEFLVVICEVVPFCLMCPFNSLQLRIILFFQFLVSNLMKGKMSENVSANRKNQSTYTWDTQFQYHAPHLHRNKRSISKVLVYIWYQSLTWRSDRWRWGKDPSTAVCNAIYFSTRTRSILSYVSPCPSTVYTLARQGYRHFLQ